jgi:hypothetical protein
MCIHDLSATAAIDPAGAVASDQYAPLSSKSVCERFDGHENKGRTLPYFVKRNLQELGSMKSRFR